MTMHTSVKSTALEPGPGSRFFTRLTSNYGMVILTVVLFALFAVLRPDTFASLLNFQLLASSRSVLLILALAITIPMVAGKIDLSVGYGVGLWQVMALSWQIQGLDYRIVIILVLVGGGIIGLLNALLVELAQVDAFIATLATGQVIFAITYWYTGGRQVTDAAGARAVAFDEISRWSLGPIPGPFVIAIVIAVIIWLVLDYLPVGRYLYAVGANPAAAVLSGIPRRRYVVGAMVFSGMLTGVAGIILASRQAGVAQANIGPEYLLPALAAVFLGSTTIRPGRVNGLGTVLGVAIAAIGISGLQQLLPGQFYLEPLFNGLTLVAAITIASFATRRRVSRAETVPVVAPDSTDDGDADDLVVPSAASDDGDTDDPVVPSAASDDPNITSEPTPSTTREPIGKEY